jgi:hypothetical protein
VLTMLNRGPAHRIDGQHDPSFVRKDLHFLIQGILSQLDQMKVKSGWVNSVVLVDTRETKLNCFSIGFSVPLPFDAMVWHPLLQVVGDTGGAPQLSGGAAEGFVMVANNH